MMKIAVLGAGGMIGHTILRVLAQKPGWSVMGTVRDAASKSRLKFGDGVAAHVFDAAEDDNLRKFLGECQPDVIVNCIGITKHRPEAEDPVLSCRINAIFPHKLAEICESRGIRIIHISSDCVFSGRGGLYTESDPTDALDIYGKTKSLGELHLGKSVTLRTSTIGHEIGTKYGLLEWFLDQSKTCKGFSQAYFSGLPTVTLARLVRDIVIPQDTLTGLYHVGAERIDKYHLLQMLAEIYGKKIEIIKDEDFKIDRSLNSTRFNKASGFVAPSWKDMLTEMYEDHKMMMSDKRYA